VNNRVDNSFTALIILLAAVATIAGSSRPASPAVSSVCDDCHTMHASQDGQSPDGFVQDGSEATHAHLTLASCLGCHGLNGSTVGGAPNIFGKIPGEMTAAGTFAPFVVDNAGDDYHKVHNVRDMSPWTHDERELLYAIPGVDTGGQHMELDGASELYCAGYRGCHGRHDESCDTSDKGIKGFHHGTYEGYRYLQFYDNSDHTPIKGKGSPDWEYRGADESNHNVYYAMDNMGATTDDSISALCAMCHGEFHGDDADEVRSGGNWIRHPTENLLSAAGFTMDSVNVDVMNNPFGFHGAYYEAVSTDNMANYTTDGARVTCLSCHRAHGTHNPDILRFDYGTQNAGSTSVTTGCLGCHAGPRGGP
jgi:hypothetical protein